MEFAEIAEPAEFTAEDKKFLQGFQQSVEGVNMHKAGKIKKSKTL